MSGGQCREPLAVGAPDCAGRNGAHTAGPWSAVADPAVYDSLTDIMDSEGNYVAFTCGTDLPTMEANARLIAAAPELLEACRQASDMIAIMLDDCGRVHGPALEVMNALDAAIAKAEGRS